MKYKHIHFIVNPTAGKQEAILPVIIHVMEEGRVHWDLSVIPPAIVLMPLPLK